MDYRRAWECSQHDAQKESARASLEVAGQYHPNEVDFNRRRQSRESARPSLEVQHGGVMGPPATTSLPTAGDWTSSFENASWRVLPNPQPTAGRGFGPPAPRPPPPSEPLSAAPDPLWQQGLAALHISGEATRMAREYFFCKGTPPWLPAVCAPRPAVGPLLANCLQRPAPPRLRLPAPSSRTSPGRRPREAGRRSSPRRWWSRARWSSTSRSRATRRPSSVSIVPRLPFLSSRDSSRARTRPPSPRCRQPRLATDRSAAQKASRYKARLRAALEGKDKAEGMARALQDHNRALLGRMTQMEGLFQSMQADSAHLSRERITLSSETDALAEALDKTSQQLVAVSQVRARGRRFLHAVRWAPLAPRRPRTRPHHPLRSLPLSPTASSHPTPPSPDPSPSPQPQRLERLTGEHLALRRAHEVVLGEHDAMLDRLLDLSAIPPGVTRRRQSHDGDARERERESRERASADREGRESAETRESREATAPKGGSHGSEAPGRPPRPSVENTRATQPGDA